MPSVTLRKNWVEVNDDTGTWPLDILALTPKPSKFLTLDESRECTIDIQMIRLPNDMRIPIIRKIKFSNGDVLTNIR